MDNGMKFTIILISAFAIWTIGEIIYNRIKLKNIKKECSRYEVEN